MILRHAHIRHQSRRRLRPHGGRLHGQHRAAGARRRAAAHRVHERALGRPPARGVRDDPARALPGRRRAGARVLPADRGGRGRHPARTDAGARGRRDPRDRRAGAVHLPAAADRGPHAELRRPPAAGTARVAHPAHADRRGARRREHRHLAVRGRGVLVRRRIRRRVDLADGGAVRDRARLVPGARPVRAGLRRDLRRRPAVRPPPPRRAGRRRARLRPPVPLRRVRPDHGRGRRSRRRPLRRPACAALLEGAGDGGASASRERRSPASARRCGRGCRGGRPRSRTSAASRGSRA